MMCPSCKEGKCAVINLSRKYEAVLREIDEEMLLPPTELGILSVLYTENRDLFASDIAEELDCSFQLVGKRGKIMAERGLVDRTKNNRNRRVFSITKRASDDYFENNGERHLDLARDFDD
jgi:DNA-binding MarR family transcriptional regulator